MPGYWKVQSDGSRVFIEGDSKELGLVATLAADTTLTEEDSGKVYILDNTTGENITLPALAPGLKFKFVVGASFATDNWVIASSEGDNINGTIADMGSTVAGVIAGDEDQINFVATAETIGDWVEFVCDFGNSQWIVTGMCGANGGITATDPA